ncbi:MAG: hypothetical protein CVU11_00100 [Bacteroidetes bacterium HGW-Bacteroidetes-6]|nr:MAG: hypothetical protein CVU11_00100 [Bacteroidetes bacterium HGW-Bacteroidetes-6]
MIIKAYYNVGILKSLQQEFPKTLVNSSLCFSTVYLIFTGVIIFKGRRFAEIFLESFGARSRENNLNF